MTDKHGIENLWRVLAFLVEAGNVMEAMKEKTNIVAKAMCMSALFDEVMALTKVDLKLLSKEYKDWSPEERAELVKRSSEKYDIKNDVMEAQIETGLSITLRVADCVADIVEFTKTVRGK